MSPGSLHDFLALSVALRSYRFAERNATDFDGTSVSHYFIAQRDLRAREVTSAAVQAGYTLDTPKSPLEWAERMVGSFDRHIRRVA